MDAHYGLVQTLGDHSSSITAVRFTDLDNKLRMISCGADKSILLRNAVTVSQFIFLVLIFDWWFTNIVLIIHANNTSQLTFALMYLVKVKLHILDMISKHAYKVLRTVICHMLIEILRMKSQHSWICSICREDDPWHTNQHTYIYIMIAWAHLFLLLA